MEVKGLNQIPYRKIEDLLPAPYAVITPILTPTCKVCSGLLRIRSVILLYACRCGGIRLGSRRFSPRNLVA